jgi:hypothetical protein
MSRLRRKKEGAKMTWEYREFDVHEASTSDRNVVQRLYEGWELVGLHRKVRRSRPVIVAIMRRPVGEKKSEPVQAQAEARIA